MTEALIGDLAKIGVLSVISRTSAMRYKKSDKSLPEIAQEQGHRRVLVAVRLPRHFERAAQLFLGLVVINSFCSAAKRHVLP